MMIESLWKLYRGRTALLLAACVLCATGALLIGIDDNALGILLAMLAGISLVLSVVHPWRSHRKYKRLALMSLAAIVALLALGIGLSVPPDVAVMPASLEAVMRVAGTVCLLAAAFLGMPAVLVGVVGALVLRRRERRGW